MSDILPDFYYFGPKCYVVGEITKQLCYVDIYENSGIFHWIEWSCPKCKTVLMALMPYDNSDLNFYLSDLRVYFEPYQINDNLITNW